MTARENQSGDVDCVIAVDVGGSALKIGVVRPGGRCDGIVSESIESNGPRNAIVSKFARAINECVQTLPEGCCWGLGFGFPGPFDYKRGRCLLQGVAKFDALFGLSIADAVGPLLRRLPARWAFCNDAEAALVGEATFGAVSECHRVLGVTLGTGLGSAFMVDGRVVRQHAVLPPDGWLYPLVFEGERADDLFSIRGFCRRAERAGMPVRTPHEAYVAAMGGHPRLRALWKSWGSDLGRFLRPWVEAFAADRVLLLGGLAGAADLFAADVAASCRCPTATASLGAPAAALGIGECFFGTRSI